jgi:phage FluMu protein Com
MYTPFGVVDFAAELTSAVDLQTNEISVTINFNGSNDTYIAVIKTSPQNAWKMYKSTQRNEHIYDEIMSDLENCKKFEAWFKENVVDDLIEECPRCQGMGEVTVNEKRYDDGRGGYDFDGGEEIDCPRCEGEKYELIN